MDDPDLPSPAAMEAILRTARNWCRENRSRSPRLFSELFYQLSEFERIPLDTPSQDRNFMVTTIYLEVVGSLLNAAAPESARALSSVLSRISESTKSKIELADAVILSNNGAFSNEEISMRGQLEEKILLRTTEDESLIDDFRQQYRAVQRSWNSQRSSRSRSDDEQPRED